MDKLHLIAFAKSRSRERRRKNKFRCLLEMRKLFEMLTEAYQETKFAVLSQMPLEMVVLEWGEEEPAAGKIAEVAQSARGPVVKWR